LTEIYDFFSRKNLYKLVSHDIKQNSEVVSRHGKYIGVLTKQQTRSLRQTIDLVQFKKNQLELLIFEYEEIRSEYEQMSLDAVAFLDAKKNGVNFNLDEWDLFVDLDGHCWVVK